MSASCRYFVVDSEDRILRLTSADLNRLFGDPESFPILRLANQRVRAAEAVVELKDRQPVRLLRLVYFLLPFDGRGVLDRADVERRQLARLDELLDDGAAREAASSGVLDRRHRFTVQGGRWRPSPRVEAELTAAALGEISCERFSL